MPKEVFIIGVGISCFLLALLLIKKGKTLADHFLMGWMLLIIVHLGLFYSQYSGLAYKYPHLLGAALAIPVLHGVILYFYATALIRKKSLPVHWYLFNFLPFLILLTLAIPFYIQSPEQKVEIFQNEGKGFEWYMPIQMGIIVISGIGYSWATLKLVKNYQKRLQDQFSDVQGQMLKWLEYLAIGLGLIWVLAFFFEEEVIFSGVVLFVLFIGIFGINQVPVFNTGVMDEVQKPNLGASPDDSSPQYARSGLDENKAITIKGKLEALMQKEKPFTNPELTLRELASMLDIPPNQLSQVINSVYHKSFYVYINGLRIQEFLAVAMLPQNQNYTFLAIAFDCGFNSKTTFNKYFRLETGKTPTEYFKSQA